MTLTKNRGVGGVIVNQKSQQGFLSRRSFATWDLASLSGEDSRQSGHRRPKDLSSTSRQPRVPSHVPCYTVPPMTRQRLGQHFLADLHWREEIARAIRVSPHSIAPLPRDERSIRVPIHQDDQHCWIEIGSGHGEMTQHLLASGAPVHAIEIDSAFIAGLRHLAKQFPNLTVVPGDILKADLAAIASGRRIRIYGNLPYY